MLVVGIDSWGKTTKSEYVKRACKQLVREGYDIFADPIYCPGQTMESIIRQMHEFFDKNSRDVRRALLVSMLSGCENLDEWTQRRNATWKLIYEFASYMHTHEISFTCVIGGDASMWDGAGPNFPLIQWDIRNMWRELGCETYTGMESDIGLEDFRDKVDRNWHIQQQYKEQAVDWIIHVIKDVCSYPTE